MDTQPKEEGNLNPAFAFDTPEALRAWARQFDALTPTQDAAILKVLAGFTDNQRHQYNRLSSGWDDAFKPENRTDAEPELHFSPSGRYRLEIQRYGDWRWGRVYRVKDNIEVGSIQRNFWSFFFCWLEDHCDGNDWLVGGEDYPGQTFCNLTTGEVQHALEIGAFEGVGFCWNDAELLPDGRTLMVGGCYWACPYETRLYDVTNPSADWPQLTPKDDDGELIYQAPARVTCTDPSTFKFEETQWVFTATGEWRDDIELRRYKVEGPERGAFDVKYPHVHEAPDAWTERVVHATWYKRVGNDLRVVQQWDEPVWAARAAAAAEKCAARDAHNQALWEDFKATDPLYATLAELPGSWEVWRIGNSQHAKEQGDPNEMYCEVHLRPSHTEPENLRYRFHAEIRWGCTEGQIRLEVYGADPEDRYARTRTMFPRDVEGLRAAWWAGWEYIDKEVV